jgi:hypothetical protein
MNPLQLIDTAGILVADDEEVFYMKTTLPQFTKSADNKN